MKLSHTRYCVRGNSPLMSITATAAAVESARLAMRSAAWQDMAEPQSDLPPHKYEQVGVKATYDAYMYGGDYVADSTQCQQRAYCGAVCYSFRIPTDALDTSSPCALSALSLRVYGDRWLSQGAVVDVFFTAHATPPGFAAIEDGTAVPAYTTGTPAAAGAESPAFPPPLQCVARSNAGADSAATVSLPVAHILAATDEYMHVVLRLADYTHLERTDTGAVSTWIEGSAAIVGSLTDLTFSREVGRNLVAPAAVPNQIGWDEDFENSATYSFRHFVFDIANGSPSDRDLLHHPEFPLAGILRNTYTAEADEADDARPYFTQGVDVGLCGVLPRAYPPGPEESRLSFDRCIGYYSALLLRTFVTSRRRYTGLRLSVERYHRTHSGPNIVGGRDTSVVQCTVDCPCLLRVDAYALPWPLLVFPKGDGGDQYMKFAQAVDISTLTDPGFLAGATATIRFVADPAFYAAHDPDTLTFPAYKTAGDGEAEHSLFESAPFPCAPLVSTTLDLGGTSGAEQTADVAFPVPLDTPEKTVVLLHARLVSDPHAYGTWAYVKFLGLLEGA